MSGSRGRGRGRNPNAFPGAAKDLGKAPAHRAFSYFDAARFYDLLVLQVVALKPPKTNSREVHGMIVRQLTILAGVAAAALAVAPAKAETLRLMTGPQGGVWVPLGGA